MDLPRPYHRYVHLVIGSSLIKSICIILHTVLYIVYIPYDLYKLYTLYNTYCTYNNIVWTLYILYMLHIPHSTLRTLLYRTIPYCVAIDYIRDISLAFIICA